MPDGWVWEERKTCHTRQGWLTGRPPPFRAVLSGGRQLRHALVVCPASSHPRPTSAPLHSLSFSSPAVYDNLTSQVIPQIDPEDPDTLTAVNVTVIDAPNARSEGVCACVCVCVCVCV